MEAKLKALRVVDLREILQKASVAIPPKSNKSDLIAKILATPAAVDVFHNQGSAAPPSAASKVKPAESQGGPDDDLVWKKLAPPEEFDWGSASAPNGGPATSIPTTEGAIAATTKDASSKPATSTAAQTQPAKSAPTHSGSSSPPKILTATVTSQDEEEEKRKRRAARFGIPLVETQKQHTPASNGAKAKASPKLQSHSAEDAAKLEARAARFGIPKSTSTGTPDSGQKRARSPAPVDNEEMERRKKRAERFSSGGTKS